MVLLITGGQTSVSRSISITLSDRLTASQQSQRAESRLFPLTSSRHNSPTTSLDALKCRRYVELKPARPGRAQSTARGRENTEQVLAGPG